MLFLKQRTNLKEDAVIGLIFSSFFGLGLFIASMSPASVDIKTITLGNMLAIAPSDTIQLVLISSVSLANVLMKWKDLMVVSLMKTMRVQLASIRKTSIYFLSATFCLLRGGSPDSWSIFGDRHGNYTRSNRLFVNRSFSTFVDTKHHNRNAN